MFSGRSACSNVSPYCAWRPAPRPALALGTPRRSRASSSLRRFGTAVHALRRPAREDASRSFCSRSLRKAVARLCPASVAWSFSACERRGGGAPTLKSGPLIIFKSPSRSEVGSPKGDPERYFAGKSTFLCVPMVYSSGREKFLVSRTFGFFRSNTSHATHPHIKVVFGRVTICPCASCRRSAAERCMSTCLLKWARVRSNAMRLNSSVFI